LEESYRGNYWVFSFYWSDCFDWDCCSQFLAGFFASQHPIERLFILFVSGIMALAVYNIINGDEPEQEIKEKQGIK